MSGMPSELWNEAHEACDSDRDAMWDWLEAKYNDAVDLLKGGNCIRFMGGESPCERLLKEKGEAECLLGEYGAGGTPAGLVPAIRNLQGMRENAENKLASAEAGVRELRSEVNCRVQHGAQSNGHLEYVEAYLNVLYTVFD